MIRCASISSASHCVMVLLMSSCAVHLLFSTYSDIVVFLTTAAARAFPVSSDPVLDVESDNNVSDLSLCYKVLGSQSDYLLLSYTVHW